MVFHSGLFYVASALSIFQDYRCCRFFGLANSDRRDTDLRTLLQAQLLFWLLAATDGHAKNFSIHLLPQAHYQLTPLYDVLSAWPVIGKGANRLDYKLAASKPGARTLLPRDRRGGIGLHLVQRRTGKIPALQHHGADPVQVRHIR